MTWRTNCYLKIGGTMTAAQLTQFEKELKADEDDHGKYTFHEIAMGDIDNTEFSNALNWAEDAGLKISYCWWNNEDTGIDGQITYYNAATKESHSFAALHGEMVLPISKALNKEKLFEARKWAEFEDNLSLNIVVPSSRWFEHLNLNQKQTLLGALDQYIDEYIPDGEYECANSMASQLRKEIP